MMRNVLRLIRFIVLANALCMFSVNVAAAWDGERQGFLLGIGLGYGSAKESYPVLSGDVTGLATDFKIGYAFSNQEALIYATKSVWGKFNSGAISTSDTYIDQLASISFISWFSERTPSLYVTGGVGKIASKNLDASEVEVSGIGIHLGIGFEFVRHWSIELNYVPPAPVDFDGTIKMYLLTVNVLAY